jgi:hypothetical protein
LNFPFGVQKLIYKLRTMAMVEATLKSPFIPLFQRGKFPSRAKPLLGKEGKGRFFGGTRMGRSAARH